MAQGFTKNENYEWYESCNDCFRLRINFLKSVLLKKKAWISFLQIHFFLVLDWNQLARECRTNNLKKTFLRKYTMFRVSRLMIFFNHLTFGHWRHIDNNKKKYIDRLAEVVAIPSVSAWPETRDEIVKMCHWVADVTTSSFFWFQLDAKTFQILSLRFIEIEEFGCREYWIGWSWWPNASRWIEIEIASTCIC